MNKKEESPNKGPAIEIKTAVVTSPTPNEESVLKKLPNDYFPTQKCGIVFDERMAKHKLPKGNHPERPDRILSIHKKLKDLNILPFCVEVPARPATLDELKSVHSEEHIEEIAATTQKVLDREGYPVYFGRDTYCNEFSAEAASLAVGGLIDLCEKVIKGELNNGYAIIRPPGHHCESSEPMGFCLYNNVAIVAKLVQTKWNVKRILIVDWDVHHGNGTQHIFEDDPNILYFSLHRFDDGKFYPGTGSFKEVGKSKGEGFSVNIPFNSPGKGDAEYISCFEQILLPIASQFNPELILVSAGFDAALGDPLGGMRVTPQGYSNLTSLLCGIGNGKVVVALEGGYNLLSISNSSVAVVKTLLGEKFPVLEHSLDEEMTKYFLELKSFLSKYWNCFLEDNLASELGGLKLEDRSPE